MYAQLRHLFGKRDFLIAREYQASLLFTIAQRYIVYLDSIFNMKPYQASARRRSAAKDIQACKPHQIKRQIRSIAVSEKP